MKRILREVSVGESADAISNFMKLVANEKFGHYWLHQLNLLMRKEPTHVLTNKWLEDLSSKYTWAKTEKHFLETKRLWFNEPQWPFQICVLDIGGMDNETLFKEWESHHNLAGDIKHFSLLSPSESKKICLIRLEAGFLGLSPGFKFGDINRAHPDLNLSPCPPETAFFLRSLVKEYYDSELTLVAMDFRPPDTMDKSKRRVYRFAHDRGYGHGISLGAWDISDKSSEEIRSWWIFQYNLLG